MSFNPDQHNEDSPHAENLSQEELLQENCNLRLQIEELTRRLSRYEIVDGHQASQSSQASQAQHWW